MQGNIVPPKTTPRPHLSEAEAASQLGMSVEQFRTLIRETVGHSDPEMKNPDKPLPNGFFHPSDIVVLRMMMLARANGGGAGIAPQVLDGHT